MPTLDANTHRHAHSRFWDSTQVMRAEGAATASPANEKQDHDFLRLLAAYRCVGGLAKGAEIAVRPQGPGLAQLARNIVQRRVLSFPWRGEIWLPFFQFSAGSQAVRADVQGVIDALAVALSDWEMASWFVAPNAWLDDRAPVLLLASHHERVYEAARATGSMQPASVAD